MFSPLNFAYGLRISGGSSIARQSLTLEAVEWFSLIIYYFFKGIRPIAVNPSQ